MKKFLFSLVAILSTIGLCGCASLEIDVCTEMDT